MSQFKDRPTADLIVVFLTAIAGLAVIIVLLNVMWAAAHGREAHESISWVSRIINTIVGGIFGYLAGRTVTNGNGKKEDQSDPGSS